jgi:anti-anti-sigma factor
VALLDIRIAIRDREQVLVELRGDLADETWTERLDEFLHEHYVDNGIRNIRVNLSEVHRIDLAGVSTLVLLAHEAKRHHKRLIVEGADGGVRDQLQERGVLAYLERGADQQTLAG